MAWAVEFAPAAAKDLQRLDRTAAQRLLRFLDERIRHGNDPRAIGEALRGERLGAYWKYRVGDYRLICRIEDARVVVAVVRVGHRGGAYQK